MATAAQGRWKRERAYFYLYKQVFHREFLLEDLLPLTQNDYVRVRISFCLVFFFHGFTAFDFSEDPLSFFVRGIYERAWMSESDPVPSVRARQGLAAQVLLRC